MYEGITAAINVHINIFRFGTREQRVKVVNFDDCKKNQKYIALSATFADRAKNLICYHNNVSSATTKLMSAF